MSKTTKYALIAGGIGLAVYLGKRLFTPAAAPATGAFAPAAVVAGQLVSADTYRVLAAQRSGLNYVPAQGSVGGEITFTPSAGGTFTRNVVVVGGQIMAEVAP